MQYLSFSLAAALILAAAPNSHAATPTASRDEVRQALADQEHWLAGQPSESGWNNYLLTAQLKQELEKAGRADPAAVQKVLARYQSREPGLQLTRFVATRKALEAWIDALQQPTLSELPALARAAKQNYQPIAKSEVIDRQTAAEGAVHRLDNYLNRPGNHGSEWRAHLGLKELQAQLAKGLQADPAALRKLSDNYFNGDPGLELRAFCDVGKSTRAYADVLAAYQNTDAKSAYEKQLDSLSTALDAAASKPNDVDRRQLGDTIDQLAATGAASQLVRSLKGEFNQPNVLVRVSKDIVAGGIDDNLNEKTPIDDNILGTQISGTGDTTGRVTSTLVPSRNSAKIELELKGRTLAHTVGWNGPVTIFAHSTTSLYGRKLLTIDGGTFGGEPACAECCTNSCIDCLDICGGRIIQHIATKRVYSSKSTAEAISAEHAETRLEHRMDSRTGELIERSNSGFNEQFRNPLVRRGAFPQRLEFSTTRDALSVVGLQARSNELAANTAPPNLAGDADISIRLHESLIDNFAGAAMPGKSSRSLAYRRSMRDLMAEPYDRAEFLDFVACLAEGSAPADKRDDELVIHHRAFESLMKDRFNMDVTQAEYDALAKSLYDAKLTRKQYDTYLSALSKDPLTYDALNGMLKEGIDINYGATTFADENPVEARFQDGKVLLVLRLKSTTQPKLDGQGHRIINPYPAEVYVTYQLTHAGGQVTAARVEGEYGVKALPMPGGGETKLSSVERTRRSTILTKTLPRRFFGAKGEAAEPDEEAAEPIFPASKSSAGLTLRGRWKKLGELPWAQLTSQDGWLALGWKHTGNRTADSANPRQLQANNRFSCRLVL